MNTNRMLGWIFVGMALVMAIIAAVYSAAQDGVLLPLLASVVFLAAVFTGLGYVWSLAYDRIKRAQAHLISETLQSTLSKQTGDGGYLVAHHRSVVVQAFPPNVPQLPAPVAEPVVEAPKKKERTTEENNALILIETTIKSDVLRQDGKLKYGPMSNQLITEEDAKAASVTAGAGQWQLIIEWMKNAGIVYSIPGQGVFFENRLLAWGWYKKLTEVA